MINDIIYKRSVDSKNRIFATIDDKNISYKLFNDTINSIALTIKSRLSEENKRIKINCEDNLLLLSSIIACNRTGMIPIIFPHHKALIKDIDYDAIATFDIELNDNNCIIQAKKQANNIKYEYRNDDIQCILFTTGTSLKPKAVELSFMNIFSSVKLWSKILNFSKHDRYLNVLPLHHISSLSIFFRAIYYDFTMVLKKYNKTNIIKMIETYKINSISVVPKIVQDIMIHKNAIPALKKMKYLLIGGDSINKDIYIYLFKNKINSYITYGMTETSSGISGYWIAKQPNYLSGYIGLPHQNVMISLNNRKIKICSKTVMQGYVGGDRTNENFISKDFGIIKNNNLIFLGRGDNFIISGGENINLKIIENIISDHSKISQAIVVKFNDLHWGEIPVLIFKSINGKFSINEVREYCRKKLPSYMVPKYFVNMNIMPGLETININNKFIENYIKSLNK